MQAVWSTFSIPFLALHKTVFIVCDWPAGNLNGGLLGVQNNLATVANTAHLVLNFSIG